MISEKELKEIKTRWYKDPTLLVSTDEVAKRAFEDVQLLISTIEQQAKDHLEYVSKMAKLLTEKNYKITEVQRERNKLQEENEHLRTKLQQIDGQRMDAERELDEVRTEFDILGGHHDELLQKHGRAEHDLKIAVEALEQIREQGSLGNAEAVKGKFTPAGKIADSALSQIGKENSHETT